MRLRETLRRVQTAFKVGAQWVQHERLPAIVKGDIFFELRDPKTGRVALRQQWVNRITLDSSLLIGRLLKDPNEPVHGINMLAVGTGALGDPNAPDAPPNTQRRLNNEIDRKTFSEVTFRDSEGNAVAYPTNVLDFTCIFSEAEAVGPLNEMGLVSTVSANRLILNLNPNFAGQGGQPYDTTIDTTQYDTFSNFHTHGVVNKPSNMVLAITWRLTT